jgi:hypothetical protein
VSVKPFEKVAVVVMSVSPWLLMSSSRICKQGLQVGMCKKVHWG